MSDDVIGTATDLETGATAPLKKGKPGRPCGLTEHKHTLIVKAFRTEASIQTVAGQCNVAYSTLTRWLHMGRNGHPDYEFFAMEVAQARNFHKSKWSENVERIAEGETPQALRANLTLLARQFPDEWGDRDTVALDEHKAKRDEADFLKTLTADEVKFLQAINAKRLAADNDE